MSWLRFAEDPKEAFLSWAKAEGAKFPEMRRLLTNEPLRELERQLEQERDPEKRAQLQADIYAEKAKPFPVKLEELDAVRPVFVTVEQKGYPPEKPKVVVFGSPRVNIRFLHEKAKEFGVPGDREAGKAVKEFLDWFEHEMDFPLAHRPPALTEEERREQLKRMKQKPGTKYYPGTKTQVVRPFVPEREIPTEDPFTALQRGRPWVPGTPTKPAETAPSRLPDLQKKVDALTQRLRKRLEKKGVPTGPQEKSVEEKTLEAPDIEDIPRSQQEEERELMREIQKQMVEEGVVEPGQVAETPEGLVEQFQELLELGSVKISADGGIEVAPEVTESMDQDQVDQLVRELTGKVRDPKKVSLKIKVSR